MTFKKRLFRKLISRYLKFELLLYLKKKKEVKNVFSFTSESPRALNAKVAIVDFCHLSLHGSTTSIETKLFFFFLLSHGYIRYQLKLWEKEK